MGWWQSALRAVGLRTTAEQPTIIVAGAAVAEAPGFSPVASMASLAAFPWVRACLDAIGQDMARLPLRLVEGEEEDAQRAKWPPDFRRLLMRPQVGMARNLWERQLLTYLLPSGNAYILRVGAKPEKPTSLILLHPDSVRVVADSHGYPAAYEHTPHGGSPVLYAPSLIIHIRLPNWESGTQSLYGEGLIRALSNDLTADQAASKLSASQAKQGRPAAIFAPKERGLTPEQGKMVVDAYARVASENRAAMALPVGFEVQFPTYSLRDMEFTQQRTLTRETVLAAFGVPPTRVGLPTANYATSQQQDQVYWSNLQSIAAILDAALSDVAAGWGVGLRVQHDFSGVPALQASRSERLNRVTGWVMLGADPAEAAAYEGFDDAPVGEAMPAPAPAAEPAKSRSFGEWWGNRPVIRLDAPKLEARVLDPEDPRLEQSDYERPPYPFVLDLRDNWPKIWEAGGNIRGNEAFEYWTKYQDGDRSEGVLAWLKEREAWAARHYEDGDMFMGDSPEHPTLSNIGGVVAWLKWGVVGQLGMERIQEKIATLKADLREADRTLTWRGWLDEVHSPQEASLARASLAALRLQRASINGRLDDVWPSPEERSVRRDAVDQLVAQIVAYIFPQSTQDMLGEATKESYRRGVRAAYARAAAQVGATLAADRVDPVVAQLMAVMVKNVNGATMDMLSVLISDGIREGLSANDMQARIQAASGFSPMRSLRIARTETTRSVNAGSQAAWQTVATDTGITIRMEWLSARDSEVRDEHRELDGQIINLGGTFTIESGPYAGKKASGPGDFDDAALVCNCRCTTLPVVD